ncbi:two-component system, response regulator [Caballeronia calidae]|uniref:Two-component system, response regulator n=1 Tax=Caballeronia calidae TaxID=1777139 RepID=A0A157ZN12_9BURK|nr:response regulator [Caballeronia calidae]SAK46898.1 two-component system, response regulator [Caballeronia calidae]
MMHEYKIRIVVADDRPVVLYGLQSWFESHERFQVTACVRNADQLFARLKAATYDLIVVGCGMEAPGAKDFAFMRALRQAFPDTPVVAFTEETGAPSLAALQRSGVSGIASTRDEARAFERVCERVLSGAKNVLSPRIAAWLGTLEALISAVDASPDYGATRIRIRQFITPA